MKSHYSHNSLYTDIALDLLAKLRPLYETFSVVLEVAGEMAVSNQQATNMRVVATAPLMETPLCGEPQRFLVDSGA